mgnify:FL=1
MFKKIALIPVLSLCCMVSAFEISTDFPGGNIEVLEKSDNGAKVAQQIRDTSEWWFYWNFEVSGAAGKTLEFKFANGDPIGSFGPAASYDGGKTWEWLGAGCVKRGKDTSSFKVSIPQNAQSARFAFCIPYMPADFDALAKEIPSLKKHPLCKTRKGRENYYYTLGNPDGKLKIFLTSRHHACESTGTYVMEGILRELAKNGSGASRLLEDAEIIAVPFMDLDGVVEGDQGKYRKPHDHNRDYSESPIYPSVAAFKSLYNKASESAEKVVALDLHSPWMFRGGKSDTNNRAYFVEPLGAKLENLRRFSGLLESETMKGEGRIVHKSGWDVKYGTLWNKGNAIKSRTFSVWTGKHPKAEFTSSFETPYSENEGAMITRENLLGLGADFAKALEKYFRQ